MSVDTPVRPMWLITNVANKHEDPSSRLASRKQEWNQMRTDNSISIVFRHL